MATEKSSASNLAEMITALSSTALVLRTEDRELFDKIRSQFMACLAPEDILACTLIDRLVDEMWFIKRYGRHQTLAIERWYRQSLDFQVQRLKAQNGRKEVLAQNLAEVLSHKPPEVAGLIHLEKKVGNPVEEIDEILERTPTELEHNRALEKGILFQEQLDRLVTCATKRFKETLELLEHYKEGLAQRLRQAAEDLIDPSSSPQGDIPRLGHTEGPSIVPSEEETLDDEAVNQTPSNGEKG